MRTTRKAMVLAAGVLSAVAIQAIAADGGDGLTLTPQMSDASQSPTRNGDTGVTTKTFKVQNVDPATRTVTLKGTDGTTEEVKCGPEVRNFDQIKAGDTVTAAVTEDIAMDIRPGSEPVKADETMVASRAAEGEKPSGVLVQSGQMTGKVMAIDANKRMISLEDASGKDKTIKVRPNLDLTQIKKGDQVTVQFTHATAIIVGSPEDSAQVAATTMPASPTTRPAND